MTLFNSIFSEYLLAVQLDWIFISTLQTIDTTPLLDIASLPQDAPPLKKKDDIYKIEKLENSLN
jgi:hypothetical protein